jgi:hypothetical protein
MACAGCQCRRACITHPLHLLTSCSCSASGSCCAVPLLAAAVLRSAPQPPCRLLRAPSGATAAAALAAREAPWRWQVCRRTAGRWRRAWLHRWMPSVGAGNGERPDEGRRGGVQRGSSLLGIPSSRDSGSVDGGTQPDSHSIASQQPAAPQHMPCAQSASHSIMRNVPE